MQAYGSDRLREEDGRFILSSRLPKGWTARIERTLNQSEFPGTAVLWDGEYFEVIAVEPLPQGVRYTLAPWAEHHMMRTTSRYDADAEEQRVGEWRGALAREKKRKTAGFLALFAGHLPAVVQERLASELGVLAARMTLVSIAGEVGIAGALLFFCASTMMAEHHVPLLPLLAGGVLLVECAFRFMINWTQARPIGSFAGTIAYIVWWLITGAGKAQSPFEVMRGQKVTITDAPPDRALSDAMTMREPLATLLPVADQERLRDRHGYDYRRAAPTVAGILLTFAVLGIISSARGRQLISLALAIAIAAEQVIRLAALRRGPAPSVIGWIVRPFLRNLL